MIEELKKLATDAPNGPWEAYIYDPFYGWDVAQPIQIEDEDSETGLVDSYDEPLARELEERAAKYIAAFNPATALKMIAVVEAVRDLRTYELSLIEGFSGYGATQMRIYDAIDKALQSLEIEPK